jgi:hypothetical protein
MQLATMQTSGYDIPQARTGWSLGLTDPGRQNPTINRMRVKGLLGLALRLLESVALAQFFGLPALTQMNGESHLT